MHNNTKKVTYWETDNGAIYCTAHLGTYATEAIRTNPKARTLHTPIGSYFRMTAAEATDFCNETGASNACESCRPRTEWVA